MDFIIKRIWYITIPTAMAVLIFQLYWLRMTYANQQVSFEQLATDALQKAYDSAIIGSLPGKKAIFGEKSSVKLATTNLNVGNLDPKSLQKLISRSKQLKSDTIFTINEPTESMNSFLSEVLSMSSLSQLSPTVLNKSYREELKNRKITLPFRLSVLKKGTKINPSPGTILVQLKNNKQVIAAEFSGVSKLLLIKILWPIVLSFLLVVLITGCISLLARIIYRQKKLENMKNDFISNISHELKTPLAILSTTNDVLLNFDGLKDQEKTERYLRLSKDELYKLQGLIDGILSLSKMDHGDHGLGKSEMIYLHDLLKVVASRFMELQGVAIELDLQINNELVNIWPDALKTVLSNLLDNAIKYTPGNEKLIRISVTQDSKHYFFNVTDFGIGISEEHQAYIFDKFYRVPQGNIHEVKGYGLGLSHVKSLVEKMGGEISVVSQLKKGSVFTVQLNKK
ncbi:His Kinase A (phospho-acceptor) domain-containing protein [Pedobacter steynii]|uniref:histidine kinase n=1 Tax=Pedobacter steynii TaxID=430522 RepID=A0A1G9N6E0_9SPHI|nr:HAMP domain-containing sensor histidine kinase [Pedobacter steynii]NQX39395.1 HAMP domain-containing histidine kinase [Pedobacter steynii]SDL82048.1 His Kinase A (phospho-acceptor) domain-containing protein [Pedobacter steynii]